MPRKIVYTQREAKGTLEEFFGHVGGKNRGIGVWVQPFYKHYRGDQIEFDERIKKVLRNKKFPTIALVEKDREQQVKEWVQKVHKEGEITKPILLLEAEMVDPKTDKLIRRPEKGGVVKPAMGFDELAKLLKGKANNVYIYGEMGDFKKTYDVTLRDRKDPSIDQQLKGNRKEALVGFCVHNVYKNLHERAEKHDFKVHYLPKHIMRYPLTYT